MITVSLYLLAMLQPTAPLGSASAGLGILAGEMIVRRKRGNYYSDVATATGRWTIVALAGAAFYHGYGDHSPLYLAGAAAVLWLGDVVTNPLVIAPMTGERPIQFMVSNIRTSAL